MHMSRTTLTTSGAKFATGLRRRKTATTLDTNVRIILRNRFVLCVAISAFFLPHAGVDPVVKNPPIERAQPACPSDHSGQHGMRPWMTDLSSAKVHVLAYTSVGTFLRTSLLRNLRLATCRPVRVVRLPPHRSLFATPRPKTDAQTSNQWGHRMCTWVQLQSLDITGFVLFTRRLESASIHGTK